MFTINEVGITFSCGRTFNLTLPRFCPANRVHLTVHANSRRFAIDGRLVYAPTLSNSSISTSRSMNTSTPPGS